MPVTDALRLDHGVITMTRYKAIGGITDALGLDQRGVTSDQGVITMTH